MSGKARANHPNGCPPHRNRDVAMLAKPFVARPTRAHPNFEVKDGAKRRRLQRSKMLEFKIEMPFSAATR
jgi:hypothetical protein